MKKNQELLGNNLYKELAKPNKWFLNALITHQIRLNKSNFDISDEGFVPFIDELVRFLGLTTRRT